MPRKLRDPYAELRQEIQYLARDIGGLFEAIKFLKFSMKEKVTESDLVTWGDRILDACVLKKVKK